jgi:hypothetical protein
LIEWLAGNDFHDTSQSLESGKRTVAPARTGLKIERRRAQARNVVGKPFACFQSHFCRFGVAGRPAAHKTGDVRQKVLDGDFARGGNRVEEGRGTSNRRGRSGRSLLRDRYFHAAEFRDELRNRVGQPQFAFFHEHQDGRPGDGFGHGGDPEERIFGHRFFGIDIHETVRFEVGQFSISRYHCDRTRDVMPINVALNGFMYAGEPLGGKPGLFGLAVWMEAAKIGAVAASMDARRIRFMCKPPGVGKVYQLN